MLKNMESVWSLDALERRTKSPHPRVRSWAIRRLRQQFPDLAGPILVPLLCDPDDGVAVDATGFFVAHPDPAVADSLYALFQREATRLPTCAAKAMAKIGDFRFVPAAIEKLATAPPLDRWSFLRQIVTLRETEGPGPMGGIAYLHQFLERTTDLPDEEQREEWLSQVTDAISLLLQSKREEEMVYLARYLLEWPPLKSSGYTPLLPFIEQAGLDYSEEEMEQEIEPALQRRLDQVHATLPKEISGRRWKENRYVILIDLCHENAKNTYLKAAEALGSDAMGRWEQGAWPPLGGLRFLRALDLCGDHLERAPVVIQKRFAAVAMVVHDQFMDGQSWLGKSPDGMTTEEQWAFLFENRPSRAEDDLILDRLACVDAPAPLVERALDEIRERREEWGALRAIALLGRLRDPSALPTLFSLLFEDEDDDVLLEVTETALTGYGAALLPHLQAVIEKGDEAETRAVLMLFPDLHFPEIVSLMLSQADRLYDLDRETFLYAIEEIGAAEFIPFVKREMRVEEPEEEAYLLLCQLHEIDDPDLPRIEAVVAHNEQQMSESLSRVLAGEDDVPIGNDVRLPLRCLDCGHTYTYRIENAWIDADDEDIEHLHIRDEVICKGCQGVNRYEVTPAAKSRTNDYLNRFYDLLDAGKAVENEGPIRVVRTRESGWRISPTEEIGLPIPPSTPSLPATHAPKVGRNDPCPCGSGKKYKKCCLAHKAPTQPPSTSITPETMMGTAEQAWIRRILTYASQPKFRWAMQAARALFFNVPTGVPPPQSTHDDQTGGQFLDWFIHDYRLDNGETVVKRFLKEEKLSPTEREITQDALDSFISLYEVQSVHPETATLEVKDLVTGERLSVRDVSGANQLVKWEIIGVRLFRVEGVLRVSAIVMLFPRAELSALLGYFTGQWKLYQEEKPDAPWKAFMKARGHLFHQYVQRRADSPPAPPQLLTSEHHEVVFCKAIYDVQNFHAVLLKLKDAFDFHRQEEKPDEVQFDWLKRGDSTFLIPEGEAESGKGASVVESSYFGGDRGEGLVVLGHCTVTARRLTLEVSSQERLAAGKERLAKILGDSVRFRMDALQSVAAALSEPKKTPRKPLPQGEHDAAMRHYLTTYYEKWLHDSIPALDGKTPMDMVNLPGGRARVEELMKDLEHNQQKQRRNGHAAIDIGWMWKRLGFLLGEDDLVAGRLEDQDDQ